jgi:uncharacterized protein (DUF2141 family)
MHRVAPVLALLLSAFAWALPATFGAQPEEPKTGTSEVTVAGFRNRTGQVCVSLFSSPEGFPGETKKAVRTFTSKIDGNRVKVCFDAVPAGEYALAVLHDENMNGKMDTSFWGYPKEGAGVSNNPKSRRGPPRFDDAKFVLQEERLILQINLQYPP